MQCQKAPRQGSVCRALRSRLHNSAICTKHNIPHSRDEILRIDRHDARGNDQGVDGGALSAADPGTCKASLVTSSVMDPTGSAHVAVMTVPRKRLMTWGEQQIDTSTGNIDVECYTSPVF